MGLLAWLVKYYWLFNLSMRLLQNDINMYHNDMNLSIVDGMIIIFCPQVHLFFITWKQAVVFVRVCLSLYVCAHNITGILLWRVSPHDLLLAMIMVNKKQQHTFSKIPP